MARSSVYMRHVHRQVEKKKKTRCRFQSLLFFVVFRFFSLNLTNWKCRCVNRERDMRIVELSECIFWCVHADVGWILSMTRDILRRVNTKKKRIVTINQNRCKDIERRLAVAVFTYGTKPNGNLLLTFSFFVSFLSPFFRLFFFFPLVPLTYLFGWFIFICTAHTWKSVPLYIHLFLFLQSCSPCSRAQRSR